MEFTRVVEPPSDYFSPSQRVVWLERELRLVCHVLNLQDMLKVGAQLDLENIHTLAHMPLHSVCTFCEASGIYG